MWFFGENKERKVVHPAGRILRARFDVAQTTADNARHWANADSLSADAAASGLHTTSRDVECRKNMWRIISHACAAVSEPLNESTTTTAFIYQPIYYIQILTGPKDHIILDKYSMRENLAAGEVVSVC